MASNSPKITYSQEFEFIMIEISSNDTLYMYNLYHIVKAFFPNEEIRQELTKAIRRNAWDEMIQNQRC